MKYKTKRTTESFILDCIEIHGNKYKYDKTIFTRRVDKILIFCNNHLEYFEQTAGNHLNGQGCRKCSILSNSKNKSFTHSKFIERFNIIHNFKYDYSNITHIESKKNNGNSIVIRCKKHGLFTQSVSDHLYGCGCKKCGREKTIDGVKYTLDEFIQKSEEIHNYRYDYSKFEYINCNIKSTIICKIHEFEFQMSPILHTQGSGCKKCRVDIIKKSLTLTTDEWISRCEIIHKNYYKYNNSIYITGKQKIEIECPIHGYFYQTASSHLYGIGCQKCNRSKGEIKISEILNSMSVEFEDQKTFEGCKNINLLEFDFYLPYYNVCVEFDGKQHFESIDIFGGELEFEKNKLRDSIKNIFCKENNIKLIRIPYYEIDNIEQILKKELNIDE